MEVYEHMQPKRGSTSILDRSNLIGYIFEPKFDGIRVLIYKDKEDIAIFNQVKKDLIGLFPEFLDLPAFVKAKSCVVDAEIVVLNNSKVPDQELLQEREHARSVQEIKFKSKKIPASLFVFDILEKDETSLTDEPLRKRKLLMKDIITDGPNITLVPYTMHGKDLWEQIEKQKLPGMMAKESSSKYIKGASWSWLDIDKKPMTDAIVAGVETKNMKQGERISSILLAVYDSKIDHFKYIGKIEEKDIEKTHAKLIKSMIKNNLTDRPIINIDEKEKDEKIKEKEEKSSQNSIKWLEPSVVARVKFKEIQDHILIQPRIARIRLDKYARECTLD